jgi:SAM-dependent methyltransferase
VPQRGTALDIGCGDGTFLAALREKGWEVNGTELRGDRARALGIPVFENLSEVERGGRRYELITFWHSLEHLPQPREALQRAGALLSPGGVLVTAVPNAEGLQARLFRGRWLHLDVPRHLYHFGPASLERLLMASGLVPFRRWDEELEYDALGWAQSALDTLGARPRLLFDLLRGKGQQAPLWERGAHLLAGAWLLGPSVLATWASAALRQGGSLILAARQAAVGTEERDQAETGDKETGKAARQPLTSRQVMVFPGKASRSN